MEGKGGLVYQDGSWGQLKTWIAYSQIEPFGDEVRGVHSAIASTEIVNSLRMLISIISAANGVKIEYQPRTPYDFLPFKEKEQEEHSRSSEFTVEESRAQWLAMKKAMKRRFKKKV